ncbi:Eif4e1b [Symbiodinium sp. CCMP2456]|nr:Eif4e1b [Symbiodinium sp. CCMP2456]
MSGPGEEPGCPMEQQSYTCGGDAYDPMTEVEHAVDKAVANIFGIFGEELGLRVGGSLAKNMSVRRALDELLARQESVFRDRQSCQWMDHQLQLASAKAGWLTRREYLEQISIDEKAMRRSAEMELEATELRLAMAEKACRQLMQLRAEFIPSEVAPEAPSSPSAILLGNTHLRVPQDEAKKASETEEPSDSGEPIVSPVADMSADPLPEESSGAPRNPQARLVWSQDPSPDDMLRQRSSESEHLADDAQVSESEHSTE